MAVPRALRCRAVVRGLGDKLTFANVISVVALFVALGGSSYAAVMIGSGNVKNRSLRGIDVRKNTLTGAEVDEARLGLVGQAGRAFDADRATKAMSAGDADRVGGTAVTRVDYRSDSSSDRRTLLDIGGLVLEGDCVGGATPRVTVKTREDHAHVNVTGTAVAGTSRKVADDSAEDQDFSTGEQIAYGSSPSNLTVGYATQGGSQVTAVLHLMDGPGAIAPNCTIGGYALSP